MKANFCLEYYSRTEQEETQKQKCFLLCGNVIRPISVLIGRDGFSQLLIGFGFVAQWQWPLCSIVELEPDECLQYSSTAPVLWLCLDTAGFFCTLVHVGCSPKKNTRRTISWKKRCIVIFPLPWSPIQYPIKLQLNQGIWNQNGEVLTRTQPNRTLKEIKEMREIENCWTVWWESCALSGLGAHVNACFLSLYDPLWRRATRPPTRPPIIPAI